MKVGFIIIFLIMFLNLITYTAISIQIKELRNRITEIEFKNAKVLLNVKKGESENDIRK